MKIQVNGINLFFDTEGASLRASGNAMREVPTVVLLHGGPGAVHSVYKPDFTALTDVAQVIYLDHRGNGRSDDGPRELWTLPQWADDLVAFCDVLGIVKLVVCGASLGSMRGTAYSVPAHAGKLVLAYSSVQADIESATLVAMKPRSIHFARKIWQLQEGDTHLNSTAHGELIQLIIACESAHTHRRS